MWFIKTVTFVTVNVLNYLFFYCLSLLYKLSIVEIISVLLKSDLFKGMNQEEMILFLDQNTYKVNTYTKNDIFALANDKVNYLMIVLEGTLIARMVSESGKFIEIDKIEEGRIVAPAILFATKNTYPVNVIPETETSVFFIHRDSFLKAMNHNEKLLHNFIRIVSDINRFLSTKIHSLSLKSIRGKLAEYILNEANKQNSKKIKLPLTKQELANKFAIARQALSRSLSELEEESLIVVKGREILILDARKLADIE